MAKMRDFNGRVVAVTGAANGIGREMARAFARRGARLVLADIDEVGLLAVKGELEGASAITFIGKWGGSMSCAITRAWRWPGTSRRCLSRI